MSFYQHKIKPLYSNVRFYVLIFSILLSIGVYVGVKSAIVDATLQTIRLQQIYAFLSVVYLYIALLATPLTRTFKLLPLRGQYLHARRAIGVSVFYFALLHTLLVFFGQLGGFGGLGFLSGKYLLAIIAAVIALIILFLMTITSVDWAVEKLTFRRWKQLHRLVYLAGLLILFHTVMLGTHFNDLSTAIPRVLIVALIFLFMLESLRLDKYLRKCFPNLANTGAGITFLLQAAFLIFGLFIGITSYKSSSAGGGLNLGIHAQHEQIAQQAQTQNQNTTNPTGSPSLTGDRNKRYTVSFNHDTVSPDTPTELRFKVYDASSGSSTGAFQKLYTKTAHLVIVDESLTYYSHIHPELDTQNGDLVVTTTIPKSGYYRLYLNFQPLGAIEQQFGFNLQVGSDATATTPAQAVEQQLTKRFGDYNVTIGSNGYNAEQLSLGKQQMVFTLSSANDNKPITTLKPYLAAFGHLVMVNEATYDYIHVHPANARAPADDANGGPTVAFLPLGLYGPIKPGVYRVFAQFNPNGQLILADFTVKVE